MNERHNAGGKRFEKSADCYRKNTRMSTDRKIHLKRKVGICVGFAECTHIGRSHAAEQRDKRTTAGLSLSF